MASINRSDNIDSLLQSFKNIFGLQSKLAITFAKQLRPRCNQQLDSIPKVAIFLLRMSVSWPCNSDWLNVFALH